MNHTIRRADVGDAARIANIHVRVWQAHYRGQIPDDYLAALSVEKRAQDWTEKLSSPKQAEATFIFEDGGEIFGFCQVGPARDAGSSSETGEFYALYVDLSKQGQGIGSALMEAGLSYLREKDFKKAILWVLQTNKSAIGFYETRGWKLDGGQKKEARNGFVFEEIRYNIALKIH